MKTPFAELVSMTLKMLRQKNVVNSILQICFIMTIITDDLPVAQLLSAHAIGWEFLGLNPGPVNNGLQLEEK